MDLHKEIKSSGKSINESKIKLFQFLKLKEHRKKKTLVMIVCL